MNIIEYISNNQNKNIAFCIVDDIETYPTAWAKEITKNIGDYTISHLYSKGYNTFVGFEENSLLKHVSADYDYAVVFSPGSEFIQGNSFFDLLKNEIKQDFFILGHILDRKDAYYELHHQCYVINLKYYRNLNFPEIGKTSLGEQHRQAIPERSPDNIHDDYTPLWVKGGNIEKIYNHKCHGWNILSLAFSKNLPVKVFNLEMRESKKHHYPESQKDFEKSLPWLYYRNNFCRTDFVHTQNTEWSTGIKGQFDQIIIPASGTLYLDMIEKGSVIFYDYNQKSLDFWSEKIEKKNNISYQFVKTDILVDELLFDYIDLKAENTLINFSNIFCYEGTATFYPLSYRFNREQYFLKKVRSQLKNVKINITVKAACGFLERDSNSIKDLKKPTWHFNNDWR